MKNITLSIPEDLLRKSRDYALERGTSLNALVRELLSKITAQDQDSSIERLIAISEKNKIDTKSAVFSREDIYDRKVFS